MDFWHTPVPDVQTSTIKSLNLPPSITNSIPKEYWNYTIAYLPPIYKTKLCYGLSAGYRTKLVLIYQLLEDPEIDLNYKGPTSKTSIPEELIRHEMNLHLIKEQLLKRTEISTEIKNKCNSIKPGFFPNSLNLTTNNRNNRTLRNVNASARYNRVKEDLLNFYFKHRTFVDGIMNRFEISPLHVDRFGDTFHV
ncbi:hypothetical protein TRFO_06034 [Tritrichomonas foetus]|uniref:Uncharacterized protein n=1 Tax=Tritrichomonas foetus TaxID=1144522 RepID=A0A1J4K0U6_9EUKA|nr:hypothetical protein TRFO_06034 [Tritrichomonas foetus]|eukprot:OHT05049.1 hypothetical protein TRFO_06034 [Tritrichomonas foetus]